MLNYCPGCHHNCIIGQIDPHCPVLVRAFVPDTCRNARRVVRADGLCSECGQRPRLPKRRLCWKCLTAQMAVIKRQRRAEAADYA